ncbi:MAG: hypothetical protein CL609_19505 [Anaerolineaceae bacterium]|nr:hypothetical protein [Anaerolineaceae bacterium]
MMVIKNKLNENYWETIDIKDKDVEVLINHLFEIETPLNTNQLLEVFIKNRISEEKENLKKISRGNAAIFKPSEDYQLNQKILFIDSEVKNGVVIAKRKGNNPEIDNFDVIDVKFDDGRTKQYACNLIEHKLNSVSEVENLDETLDFDFIYHNYKKTLSKKLGRVLENNEDLVQIAGFWFPSSLLVDVNIGYLNLSEAVLEVAGGGPLTTKEILEQIELPTDANSLLTEFSLNYALQEDKRFDEVGPAGETLWFLHRLEPENVKQQPKHLIFSDLQTYEKEKYSESLTQINAGVFDELEDDMDQNECATEVAISIIYPHLASGTLPLSKCLSDLFPTSYEAPRIRFTIVDGDTKQKFPGWVVREHKYVYGLKDWYENNSVLPGSTIFIKQSKTPGEVIVSIGKKRNTREWVRTADATPEEQLNISMNQQLISTEFDDRMIIAIPSPQSIEVLWDKYKNYPLEKILPIVIRELAKLTPQGNVHAQEIYAVINIIKRCPPSYTLYLLDKDENIEHLGDLYYKIKH